MHNHKGFLLTSPTGSLSLKELPVPIYETRHLASQAGKRIGKPFVIVKAADFYRTRFGRMVRALSLKRQTERRETAQAQPESPIKPANALTKLLNRLKAAKRDKASQTQRIAWDAKAKADTPKPITPETKAASLMLHTLERESKRHVRLASHSYLAHAMVPPTPEETKPLSDSDFFRLFQMQSSELQHEINLATKFNWTRGRVNKLVKSGSIKSLLILFRAGRLPDKARHYRKLRKLLTRP